MEAMSGMEGRKKMFDAAKALPSKEMSSKVNTHDYATYCLATRKGQV